MSLRLWIDECLSPELVELAVAAGYAESTCSRDRGQLGKKDWELMNHMISGDYTLVTQNARDFRGTGATKPGGLHATATIHAGLVCLNSVFPIDIDRQRDLFGIALQQLAELTDLVNQALEVFEAADGSVSVTVYEIPATAQRAEPK
jgi:hypothetical protein